MHTTSTDALAQILWDYMQLHEQPQKSDAIFCLCSHDIRVAERAAELMLQGYGSYLIISGGAGSLTRHTFSEPESKVFARIAQDKGVPADRIIIEDKATNTGENIRFTYTVIHNLALVIRSLILVQKPYMERRTYATFKKQWPDRTTHIVITSPQIPFETYADQGSISKKQMIDIMVGDVQRIREYPALGYQIEQAIPDKVWSAYEELVRRGFNTHLLAT